MRSSVQSKRRRISRKAMLSLQAALLSGSLLAAPWVFAAGPGDQSHEGHATPVAMPGWTQTLKGQTVVENAMEGRAGNAEKMEMQQAGGVSGLGFGTDQNEERFRDAGAQRREGFEQEPLVLLGVDAAQIEDDEGPGRKAVFLAESNAVAGGEAGAIDAVREIGDAVVRQFPAGFVEFTLAHADDLVGVFEDAAGTEERAQGLAPLELFLDGFQHAAEFGLGNVEDPAVKGDNQRPATEAGGGADLTAEAFEGVSVKEPDIGSTEQAEEQGEGEEISTLLVERGLVRGRQAEERIAIGKAANRDATDRFLAKGSEGHRGEHDGLLPGRLLASRDFQDDGLRTAPFLGDEAPGDVDDGVAGAGAHREGRVAEDPVTVISASGHWPFAIRHSRYHEEVVFRSRANRAVSAISRWIWGMAVTSSGREGWLVRRAA